ncbi:hypothetical protein [Maioricimonas sp. JC845]|uniref:hypothetical protein n=1 Tax=Maioricimonas sp. JC845 TaxID=3232138 RepID=UPI00345A1286
MKALLVIVLLVAAGVLLGRISFSSSENDATIRLDTQEVRQDTREAAERAEDVADDVANGIDRSLRESTEPAGAAP